MNDNPNWSNPIVPPNARGPRMAGKSAESAVLSSLYSRAIFTELAGQTNNELAKILKQYTKTMYSDRSQASDLKKMHRRLANQAQGAVVEAYDARRTAGRKSYRQAETVPELVRYSGGKLRAALKNQKLIVTNEYGIGMFDIKFLDSKARQWYRMNFGALPAGSKNPPGTGSLKMFNKTSKKKLEIRRFSASAPFMVPEAVTGRGLWSNKHLRTTDLTQLFKGRKKGATGIYLYVVPHKYRSAFDPVASKGIKGSRFLDAGVKSVNDNYGDEMMKVFMGWHEKALAKGTSKNTTKIAPVKRKR